ncbi:MAG: dienelactone hydrolase family protein [Nitrososphaeraceae archaeon]
MSKKGLSWSIFLMVCSMVLFPSYMNLVQAQLSNSSNTITRNVTALSNLAGNASKVELQNSTVNYFEGAKGYLVYPASSSQEDQTVNKSKLPAVVMIHENKGLNDHIKNMANLLAKHGYVVLAVDLFKGEVVTEQNDARRLTQAVRSNPEMAINNLQSAVKYLSSLPNVDPSKIASIGWCFGGGQSLQLAFNSQNHPLAATIVYYGSPLITDNSNLSKIKWPVLGVFGDQDTGIPVEKVNEFKATLDKVGVPNEIYIFKGVGHAFANPSNANYAPSQTLDAWEKTLSFLKKYLS